MRILLTIPHFYSPQGSGKNASAGGAPEPRIRALTDCLEALHHLYGPAQDFFYHRENRLDREPANATAAAKLDVAVCATGTAHLLDRLPVPRDCFERIPVTIDDPQYLGIACHRVLADRLGQYDWYGYLEDDLILHDPTFFQKLDWFARHLGETAVLQPHRYERLRQGGLRKCYIDPDFEVLLPEWGAFAHNFSDRQEIRASPFGAPVQFLRARNPHSGCFFLNAAQMARMAASPHFGRMSRILHGPLESSASLALIVNFRVYKPAFENANFLEIEHAGDRLSARLAQIGEFHYKKRVKSPPSLPEPKLQSS